jgi:hypothetical protein
MIPVIRPHSAITPQGRVLVKRDRDFKIDIDMS